MAEFGTSMAAQFNINSGTARQTTHKTPAQQGNAAQPTAGRVQNKNDWRGRCYPQKPCRQIFLHAFHLVSVCSRPFCIIVLQFRHVIGRQVYSSIPASSCMGPVCARWSASHSTRASPSLRGNCARAEPVMSHCECNGFDLACLETQLRQILARPSGAECVVLRPVKDGLEAVMQPYRGKNCIQIPRPLAY